MIISADAHIKTINSVKNEKLLNVFIVSFLLGSAISGSIILLFTKDMIHDARMEAYEQCMEATRLQEVAERIINKNRKDFIAKISNK